MVMIAVVQLAEKILFSRARDFHFRQHHIFLLLPGSDNAFSYMPQMFLTNEPLEMQCHQLYVFRWILLGPRSSFSEYVPIFPKKRHHLSIVSILFVIDIKHALERMNHTKTYAVFPTCNTTFRSSSIHSSILLWCSKSVTHTW